MPPPPPPVNGNGPVPLKPVPVVKDDGEPIYECVIPRDENNVSPPPLPAPPHKLPARSPVAVRTERAERSTSPRTRGSPASPLLLSRPNSRASSTVS